MSDHPESQSTPTRENVPVTGGKSRHRVLLVEDDRAVRRYLQVILERAGYEVICAADGLAAMKIALAESLDAVVSDAIMPHLSGPELCRFLRSYPSLSTLPVILLSAFQSKPQPTEVDNADLCLMKPVQAEELTAHLARLIGAAKKSRA